MNISAADRLLIAALGGRGRMPSTREDWEQAVDRSLRHGASPLLYHRLVTRGECSIPDDLLSRLRLWYLEASAANTALLHELEPALKALEGAKIPVIVLKGIHLATTIYQTPALRPMSDVDLLVRPADLDRAQKILLETGCRPRGDRLPLDLHWGVSLSQTRLSIDMDGIWERARPGRIGDAGALVFAPEDLLVYLCTHLSFQHLFEGAGIRTFLDVRRIIEHCGGLDWEAVTRRAREWNNRGGVHLCLLLARRLLGAHVPPEVIETLVPAGYDDSVLRWAIEQIFTDRFEGRALSPFFWRLFGRSPLTVKGRNFVRLLFPPKEFLSQSYPVRSRSPRRFAYYPLRFREQGLDYSLALWLFMTRSGMMFDRARRHNRDYGMRDRLAT